jgi:protein-S-isoprenylcysteine O-methyltransferase Ste14
MAKSTTKEEMEVTVSAIERRKVMNWWARFSISWAIVLTFLFLVWLLFFTDLKQESRDLINILVGAYVAVLAKSTDYWFKDKDDPEHKESEALNK